MRNSLPRFGRFSSPLRISAGTRGCPRTAIESGRLEDSKGRACDMVDYPLAIGGHVFRVKMGLQGMIRDMIGLAAASNFSLYCSL